MYIIHVKHDFCAAHALQFQDGSRENLHGHNWIVEISVACPALDADGIGIDFLHVQSKLAALLDTHLDHQNLHDVQDLCRPNPTSELLARWIAEHLAAEVARNQTGARLHSVTVWETKMFGVTYQLNNDH